MFTAVVLVLAAWFVWNVWNLVRIVRELRGPFWNRPMWWARTLSVSVFTGAAAWLYGASSGGLDVEEACRLTHHQRYDTAHRAAQLDEDRRLFPLHNRCNASYDLVPAWVNPTVAACCVVAMAGPVALVVLGPRRAVAGKRLDRRA